MTYLQLSTVYGNLDTPQDLGGIAVGWFASGTGAAGLVGAGLWWILRGLGVRAGLLICAVGPSPEFDVCVHANMSGTQFLPLCMSLTYFLLLPSASTMSSTPFDAYAFVPLLSDDEDDEDSDNDADLAGRAGRGLARTNSAIVNGGLSKVPHLTTSEKMALAKPLVVRYMLPLFFGMSIARLPPLVSCADGAYCPLSSLSRWYVYQRRAV